ncbi:MAG TPA: M1 family metallopeptidase, partial [Kofleriaceae bacterium]|nr:M1 family metallopeptidase [Kofleriaceae bacterium]
MKRAWWVLVAVSCGSTPAPATHAPPPPPAIEAAFDPPPPALRLPRHFTPQRYIARLAVDPGKPTFAGEIAIEGMLDRRTAMIWMHGKHLEIARAVASDGKREVTLTPSEQGEYLGLRPAQPLDAGAWTLTITYRGPVAQNAFMGAFMTKWGETPYLSTQFESTGARLVFPCLDEPDRKAVWQLTLDVPKDLVAVSNTMPAGTTALDAQHVRIAFGATRPLPSYLVAFAVGPFDIVDAGKTKSGIPVRVFVPHGVAAKASLVASVEPQVIDFLEGWFGIPYPYGKMDLVAVPSNHGLAMENAGMIVSDSRYVLYDKPSQLDRYRIVSLFGHETAHQWFGDLVTAAWWDDIWLNESFATWIENKILLAFDAKWPSEVVTQRADALDADALASA